METGSPPLLSPEKLRDFFRRPEAYEEIPVFTFELERPDGAHRFVQTSIFPIWMGNKVLIACVTHDLTEQIKQGEMSPSKVKGERARRLPCIGRC